MRPRLAEMLSILHADTAPTWRGGQAQLWGLLCGLAARGHRQLLAAPADGPLVERARAAGLPVVPWAPRHDLDLAATLALAARARAFAPDVVHLHSARAHATGVWAARQAGAAAIVARRVDFAVARHAFSRWKYRLPVDRYVAVSHEIARVLVHCGVPEPRVTVVHSGIDVAGRARAVAEARIAGRSAALRARWGVPEGAPLVGIVAALAPHKDHANFLDAASHVARARADVRFVVAGDGPCAGDVRAHARRLDLGERLILAGFVDDVDALLGALDVFTLSSYLEGLGTSVLDAMAAGIPIVATRVGGVPEMIDDGVHGLLVPPRNARALGDALLATLARPEEARVRVGCARGRVEEFALAQTVARTEGVYRAVLAERRRRA